MRNAKEVLENVLIEFFFIQNLISVMKCYMPKKK